MKVSSRARSLLLVAVFAFVLAVSMPVLGFSQDRGHGQEKKSEKFINGHDARDGRWDGRGPRPRFVRTWRHHPRRPVVWRRREYYWRRHGHHRRD